jgi:hypothetical protein
MAAVTGGLQLTRTISVRVPAAAAGATAEVAVGRQNFAGVGTVTAVRYIADATLTGANTNTRAITVNRRTAGGAATVLATLQFNAGVNATAYASTTITLSGTPANLDVPAGDILTVTSTAVGTGLADPGGVLEIDILRA